MNGTPAQELRKFPSVSRLLHWSILATGILLVVLSAFRNWFDIPAAVNPAVTWGDVVRQTPTVQPWFQAAMVIGLIILGSVFFACKRSPLTRTLMAIVMLFVASTFPYFVMMRSPEYAADACWLQMQHDNLTWLGGDIFSEAESGLNAWKSKVYWVDPPRQVSVAPLPSWSIYDLGLDKTEDILIWLGYANVFCQFVRTGWYSAMVGSSLLVLATLLNSNGFNFRNAGYGLLSFAVLCSLGIASALYGPFAAKQHLQAAAHENSAGRYRESIEELEKCVALFPVLSQDTYYLSQRAKLESKLGLQSDFSQLHSARELESAGRYDQSFDTWVELAESNSPAIQREALRAIMRFAVQDYNCSRHRLARQRLEFVLHRQPGNVKVVHYLQIIGVRQEDTVAVYQMCSWMQKLTEHLNFSTTKVLKASSQQNAKLAAALAGDEMETWSRMIEAK